MTVDTRPPDVHNWIGGELRAPVGGRYDRYPDPVSGTPGRRSAASDATDVAAAVEAAEAAAFGWRHVASAKRGRMLHDLAQAVRANAQTLADLEVEDTGKPRTLALGEIENSAAYFEFYSTLVNLPVGDVLDVEPNHHIFTRREPYGVVGIITPWNVPLNQVARASAPALTTGNAIVVKPSETAAQSTVYLAQLAASVGIPVGAFNVVLGRGDTVGAAIVSNPGVRKVAFTGSVATGKAIGHIAADRLIPLTLELGGKSANIVFEDADLEFAAEEAVRAYAGNAGMVCSAGTRLLVHRSIYDWFVEKVVELSRQIKVGTDMGPLITRDLYDRVQGYFSVAADEGARLALGGDLPEDAELAGGFYVNPTIYIDVDNSMRIAREEVFGPVLVAIPFDTEQEAIAIANDSDFGLVGGVFTKDIGRALRVADQIEAGQVFVNSWSTGAVQTPFGGNKNSGYGREKGIEALLHYSHLKTVVVVYEAGGVR